MGVGKSYTGSHFAIERLQEMPQGTGLIAANTHDQLSQATLREFFYWLNEYGYQYCVDTRPPPSWGKHREFKDYSNVVTVRDPARNVATTILTRVLSNPDPIRGIELSWYWIDELRDTAEYAYDMVLGRLRETEHIKGICTTTTNGEDWAYLRVQKNRGTKFYGSIHVPTKAAVDAGVLPVAYYEQLKASYTELMVAQELDAKHVNIRGGRAYYAAGDWNRLTRAPWGDTEPSTERPLVIGCDFNYSPAPCIWVVGQQGPDQWDDHIHWFGEIVEKEISSPEMALRLVTRFPNFFYQIYGDYSGNIGTTSNAGETDYNQIGIALDNYGCQYSINCDQANPHVKDRVENVNGLLKNSIGQTRMTYDPYRCPNIDADMKMVGWKVTSQRGRGKLDDGGDNQRTHATDGIGYAAWKIFPPGRRGIIVGNIPSSVSQSIRNVV